MLAQKRAKSYRAGRVPRYREPEYEAVDGRKISFALKKIGRFSRILPTLVALLQRSIRYRCDIEWTDLWVGNFFRFWDIVLWRKVGIRRENITYASVDRKTGRVKITRYFYTAESLLTYVELVLRGRMREPARKYVLVPAWVGGPSCTNVPSNFMFAIAFDAATDGGFNTGTSLTYAHITGSGTGRIIFTTTVGAVASDNVTGITYAAVAETLVNKIAGDGTNNAWSYLFSLAGPATGSNNVVVSSSGTDTLESGTVTYSGASQSGPEANATNSGTAISSLTTSVTTISDNDWTVLGAGANAALSAGAGSTLRAASNGYGIFDSGGAITPAGSKSMTVTVTGSKSINAVIAAFRVGGTFTESLSDSIMLGASRTTTVSTTKSFFRAVSASIMNSVSRLVTIAKSSSFTRGVSASIMNAASRFATFVVTVPSWIRIAKPSSSSWTKVAKPSTSSWTKIAKPSTSSWTKVSKPPYGKQVNSI